MLRDAHHRNHSPLLTILHWHYVRAGELFSIIPLSGFADHVVNGGVPLGLPPPLPFFFWGQGILPRPANFSSLPRFLGGPNCLQRGEQHLAYVFRFEFPATS